MCVVQLMLQDIHTKQKLVFDFSGFVGETEGDHCKEMPAVRYGQDVLPRKAPCHSVASHCRLFGSVNLIVPLQLFKTRHHESEFFHFKSI